MDSSTTRAKEVDTRIHDIGAVVSFLDSSESPRCLTHSWCLFELYSAVQNKCSIDFVVPRAEDAKLLNADASRSLRFEIDFNAANGSLTDKRTRGEMEEVIQKKISGDDVSATVSDAVKNWVLGRTCMRAPSLKYLSETFLNMLETKITRQHGNHGQHLPGTLADITFQHMVRVQPVHIHRLSYVSRIVAY